MTRTPTRRIHGPIVSTGDLDAHLRLFGAFGLREVARRELDAAEVAAQWGPLDGATATEVVLAAPGTPYGARLLRFAPLSDVIVRDRTRGSDADAPKVIDFYAPDFARARAELVRAGWPPQEPLAEYDLPEGRFVEGHVWGPDEVVCALLGGPAEFFARFATVTDRSFSEPQSLSGPVSRLEPVVGFFREALGLDVVYRYGIDDDSFRRLVGSAPPQFALRAVNVGLDTREPYLGLIHYGLPDDAYASLLGRARPPHRGTLGATFVVDDADAVAARVLAAGGELLAPPADADTAGFGPARCTAFLAPNGGCYQAIAPRAAAA